MVRGTSVFTALGVLLAAIGQAQPTLFVPIDLSPAINSNSPYGPVPPMGDATLGGIPFQLSTDLEQFCWSGNRPRDPCDEPREVEVAVDVFGVRVVHTLINTVWGRPGPVSNLAVEFRGSAGAFQRFELVGNDHIRDYNNYVYTNQINGTSTVEVWRVGNHRMDKQRFVLAPEFHNQTLLSIRFVDTGCGGQGSECGCGCGFCQRAMLFGVTARRCPGDLDGDGDIDLSDLAVLLTHFGASAAEQSQGDVDRDGDVDLTDLATLLANFGTTCP